jgi:transcriptional regulator with XRE-family HTH domain
VSGKSGDAASYAQQLTRELGHELRLLRKKRGLTLRRLSQRMFNVVSHKTLATYEQGIRGVSVERLFELCLAMDVRPQEVIAQVYERIHANTPHGWFMLNLSQVIHDEHQELLPLRRWAETSLNAGGLRAVPLTSGALEQLAGLCGMDTADLITLLGELVICPLDTSDEEAIGVHDEE